MALRIFKDTTVPKYKSGKWEWDCKESSFKYVAKEENTVDPECVIPTPLQAGVYKFGYYLDQVEEIIFRDYFARTSTSQDGDVITIQDIKNFVLFMADANMLTFKFIDFLYTKTIDQLLNALVIYFEYFLKFVEYLLIQRDEYSGATAKVATMDSVRQKQMLSSYLSQYRLLLAREYCRILLGVEDVASFHHVERKINSSKTFPDRKFHEAFICFCTYFTWISHHRRAYNVIDGEINRLFRSGHFNMADRNYENEIIFSRMEQQTLYGRNNIRKSIRDQNSPLILEILNVAPENSPLLWIGIRKYRGNDKRMHELEMEFITAESQLSLIDVSHGILGHPKRWYNTMLVLDWHKLREWKINKTYDAYKIMRQPYIDLPHWDTFNTKYTSLKPYFDVKDIRYNLEELEEQKQLWKQRNKIVKKIKASGIKNDIIERCKREVERMEDNVGMDKTKVLNDFTCVKNKRKTLK